MEAILFTGIQGMGKSTFYLERFFRTHIRLNMDMLRTRTRERILLEACIRAKQPFVIDNTNPTIKSREPYIAAARAAKFRVIGYYFQSSIDDALRRNEARPEGQRVPKVGLFATNARLQPPAMAEGFDELWSVRISENAPGGFVVENMARPNML
jgi:predicted kinase